MVMNTINPATHNEGDVVVSFGSGDTGGRTQASAARSRSNALASPAQVRSLRSRISRDVNLTARQRRQLIDAIDINTNNRGRIRLGNLADIAEDFDDLR